MHTPTPDAILQIHPTLAAELPQLRIGWIIARGLPPSAPTPSSLEAAIEATLSAPAEAQSPLSGPEGDALRKGIRDLLRGHGYAPTGRGKPASEYLAQATAKGDFPRISALVDANNLASLRSGWPASILDLPKALGDAESLEIRRGQPEERYVFNSAGHEIKLKGLPLVARRDGEAIGNPVKDAMLAKVGPETVDTISIVYTSAAVADDDALAALLQSYGQWLGDAGARSVETGLLRAS